ncbi:hypothetical protein Desor_3884 [Desulfosporosinus orientis DSM 765]|uniref:DUF4003 domain-containing protein n=1 Tax=Desulfosporosinus orientis (strain ATCC 19365 / DSM 765 / NCIMB 8382 / VKM B-1628 / Singapore I) TaxID=768706 RepID=G7WBT6_DESOD|nr:DUF4003 family protein [Desulfosporosinus orientis]AET69333.1 hypothetical protein Desor_3884 [Desulfosporosinus orientis DSM 765]
MKEQTRRNCEQLIENRNRVKSVFSWDNGLLNLACAGIFTAKGKAVDELVLEDCKNLLKQKVGIFSNFRSTARSPITAMLATSSNPKQTLENGLLVYQLLKKDFWTSSYLPLTAMIIAQMAQPSQYEEIASRTRTIYDRMKKEHPFLTSGEDSTFCALMALSEKTDDMMIEDAEQCYHNLKPNFFSSNAVQSLSHVLALCDSRADTKCEKTMELFEKLKAAGHKYGTNYELSTLGVLAMSGGNSDEIVQEIDEIDDWLSQQKGFGFFSNITRKQRLMYAGIVTQRDYLNEEAMQTAAVNGTISLIVAQEAAIYAAVAASSAAAGSATSSN